MAKQDLYTAPRQNTTTVQEDLSIPSAEDRLKGVEHWYQNNNKIINNILIGVLALVVGIFAYTKFYKGPQMQKSNDAIFRAQTYFNIDSVNRALNGDGQFDGFLTIAKKYSGTPAGNMAHYYAGVCLLKQGKFEDAVKQLNDFDGKGTLIAAMAKGNLGDAYMELGKTDDAIKAYLDASNDKDNLLLSPIYMQRAGMAYELKNNTTEAIKLYHQIKDQFPQSNQAREMDKSLARLGDYNP